MLCRVRNYCEKRILNETKINRKYLLRKSQVESFCCILRQQNRTVRYDTVLETRADEDNGTKRILEEMAKNKLIAWADIKKYFGYLYPSYSNIENTIHVPTKVDNTQLRDEAWQRFQQKRED